MNSKLAHHLRRQPCHPLCHQSHRSLASHQSCLCRCHPSRVVGFKLGAEDGSSIELRARYQPHPMCHQSQASPQYCHLLYHTRSQESHCMFHRLYHPSQASRRACLRRCHPSQVSCGHPCHPLCHQSQASLPCWHLPCHQSQASNRLFHRL
jgi:hypothetical protein